MAGGPLSADLNKRMKKHNQKLPTKPTAYTQRNKDPWKLVDKEKLETREKVKIRERQLKSFRGRKFTREKNLGR
jgi:predicted GIY-YIG superfamily endonuclease